MIQPVIIQGPAIVIHDGRSYYVKDAITVRFIRNTFMIQTDHQGEISERVQSEMWEIDFNPVGQIGGLDKIFPYTAAQVGAIILGNLTSKATVIHTKAGTTHTFANSAITQMPDLILGPRAQFLGGMKITVLGKTATAKTDAAYYKVLASTAFNDATFDPTAIITGLYSAAYGSSPYNAMSAMDGFNFQTGMSTQTIENDDIGIAAIVLSSLRPSCSFKPANLTEAQVDTLLKHSNSGALLMGQPIGVVGTDLVITGTHLVATLKNAGAKDMTFTYGTGKHRHDTLMFVGEQPFTTGVAGEPYSIVEPE